MGDMDAGDRIYILNAVWFNPNGGAQRYRQYLEAASPIAEKYGARRVEALIPVEVIQGDFHPDYLFVVEWPNEAAFVDFVRDPHYRAVAPLREAACRRRILLRCKRPRVWMKTSAKANNGDG